MANPRICPCGCDTPPSRVSFHSPSEPCCCCSYDPFSDNSKESEIRDLSFALKKLAVMRCQTKKWRMERLQLESETRSLKQALQSFGVDTHVALKPDPLIVHYREENERLQNENEELGEKLRNLEECLEEYADQACNDPNEEVVYMREKMRAMRNRCIAEKKKMREAISGLRLKLAQAEDDTSCAALNRLRAKLRELMKDGEQADRQVADMVEKSVDTMVGLSKGCEELKETNERLRRLLADLGMSPEDVDEYLRNLAEAPDAYKKAIKESPQSKLMTQQKELENCKEAMKKLRRQLEEQNGMVQGLQVELSDERRSSAALSSELDGICVNYKALLEDIVAAKKELQEKDEKISGLLRQLRQSELNLLGMTKLQNEIDEMKPQLYGLQLEKDDLLEELIKIRGIVSERNDQIINILEQKEKMEKDCCAKLAALQAKYDAELSQEAILNKELEEQRKLIADLEDEIACLQRKARDAEELRCLNAACSKKVSDLEDELNALKELLRAAEETAKKLNDERDALISRMNAMESLANELKQRLAEEERLKQELMDKIDAAEAEMQNLRNENRSLGERMNELRAEKDALADDINKKMLELKNLMEENETIKAENQNIAMEYTEYPQQVENLQNENAKLMDDLKKRNEEANALRDENDALRRELEALMNKLKEAASEKDKSTTKLDKVQGEVENLERELESTRMKQLEAEAENAELRQQLGKMADENEALRKRLEELSKELEALNKCREENDRLRGKVDELESTNNALKAESERLKAESERVKTDATRTRSESASLKDGLDKMIEELEKLRKENERLKALQEESARIKPEADNLKSANDTLQKDVQKSKMRLDQTLADLDAERSSCNEARRELEALKNELKNLLAKIEQLKGENELLRDERDELKKTLLKLNDELSNAKAMNIDLRKENDGLKSRLANAEAEIARLEEDIDHWKMENCKNNLDVDKLKKDLDAAKRGLIECQAFNKSLEDQVSDLQKENMTLKGANDQAQSQLNNMRKAQELEKSSRQASMRDLGRARDETVSLKDELAALKAELAKLRAEKEDLQDSLADTTKRLRAANDELERNRDEISALRNEYANVKADAERLRAETEKCSAEAARLQANLESLARENDDLKINHEKLQDEYGKVQGHGDGQKVEIEKLNADLAAERSALDKMKSQLSSCQEENAKILDEAKRLCDEHEQLKKRLDALEREAERTSALEKALSDLENEKRSLLDELNNLRARLKSFEDQLADETGSKDAARRASLAAKEELAALKEELARLRAENSRLQAETERSNKLLDDMRKEQAELGLQSQKSRKSLEEAESKVGSLKDEISDLMAENAKLLKKIADLEKNLNECREENEILTLKTDKARSDSIRSKLELDRLRKAKAGDDKSTIADGDDLVGVSEALKRKMETQNDGVSRVRDYVKYLAGEVEEKPELPLASPTFLEEEEPDEEFVQKMIPPFDELIPISQQLTENIYLTEIVVQELDEPKDSRERGVPEDVDALESFDANLWLQSLTLTQLAGLHDKICLLTSSMVQEDTEMPTCEPVVTVPCPGVRSVNVPTQDDYDILNKRIAALQRQIAEKQMEAGWKLQELKKALRLEQVNLIRISDEMNLERKRNLALQMTMDDAP